MTHTIPQNDTTTPITVALSGCPAWCANHRVIDAGRPDEATSHDSALTEWEGHTLRVNRWAPADGGPTEDTLWLDDDPVTAAGARLFAARLLTAAALLEGQ